MARLSAVSFFLRIRVLEPLMHHLGQDTNHDDDTIATVDTFEHRPPTMSARERSRAAIQALREEDDKYQIMKTIFCKVTLFLILFPPLAYLVVLSIKPRYTDEDSREQWSQISFEVVAQIASMTMSGDGSVIAFGSLGCVNIFSVDPWLVMDSICESEIDLFGSKLSLSEKGSILAVNGYLPDVSSQPGFVRTYQYDGTSWTVMGQDLVGEVRTDFFGISHDLSADGNVLVVGASGTSTVHTYVYNSSHWNPVGRSIQSLDDRFGHSVALSSRGDVVAIGAPSLDTNGTVGIYRIEGSSGWKLAAKIQGHVIGETMGESIALTVNGPRLNVVASSRSLDSMSSRVQVFESNESDEWSQLGSDIVYPEVNEVHVDLSGDATLLAIGSHPNAKLVSTTATLSEEQFVIPGGGRVALSAGERPRRLAVEDGHYIAVYQESK